MNRFGLVGRSSELRRLGEAWATAGPGSPQVAMVDGPAGLGKSALLSEFLAGDPHGSRITWAGDQAETDLPFGMLGQLVPAPGDWADPYGAGRALLGHLGERTEDGPLLLALDDLHLADRASLVSLNFAIRRLRHDPVLVLFSTRSERVPDLPGSMVRQATQSGCRITLGGLGTPAVVELAAHLGLENLSRRAADRLRAITGGSPLHLKAPLREVPAEDLERLDRPLPAPASFAHLVLADLAGTPTAARRVASAAAVLGERAEIADLAVLAGLDTDTCLTALEDLGRAELLRVPAGGTSVMFDHPLVRAAIYADLGPAARRDLHRKAAQLRDGFPALQHRLAATVTVDPDLAADLEAWATGQRAGNLTGAATALVAAHRVTPPGDVADRRLLSGVELLAAAGDAKAADQHSAKLAALPETGLRLAVQGRVAWLSGRDDVAVDLARRAWEKGDLATDKRDLVAAMLAQIEILRDNQEVAVAWADRALGEGRLDPGLASHTRAQRALGLALLGRLDDAFTGLSDLADDPTAVDLGRHPELSMRGHLKMWAGPPAAAQADLAVAAALTHGDLQPFRLTAAAALALSLFHSGEWDRGQAIHEQILALAEDMDQNWVLGFLHAEAAAVPSARGDFAVAQHHVDAALAMAARYGDQATHAYADEANAFLGVCRGDPQAVVKATARLRTTRDGSPQRNLGILGWPFHLVVALIELGRLDEADSELQGITRRARPDQRRTWAAVLRVNGQLAAARHDLAQARGCFTEAVELADERVDALERALALEAFGRFLRRRGERRAAIERLRDARDRYRALGAAPFLDRSERELSACGVHEPAVAAPPDPLTPQERAVAALVCAGRTNRQVADELVLSVKTIDYHLGNVYTKLGVHNRAQLVAAMLDRPESGHG